MINKIVESSLKNKLIVLLATATMAGFGIFALLNIPIGAVPDVTNNQVQVITTSRNLSTLDVERFITYPVELEMANLPGLVEIRSVSKFGLSVVTIVFEDNMGTYLPRQLIAERIQSAMENIPEGFGTPFMGPISTGLGEIYQYIIEVDSAHQGQYSTMDLRTIQDWIVRRQLSGISGVVEVNTWGGYLRQFEVAINPEKLRALNLTIEEVYRALEMNNSIVGGGYIEKTSQSYFIRSEGLIGNTSELASVVVARRGSANIRISDVATVQEGYATRFGSITANGEGEKVLGQVMMLKGANSSQVIADVKKRVEEVSGSLPDGIHINGFLERSALIGKTTFTIAENLILGCLIVIFVVVLLLGNMRSGLVIASVIPLSLLFALSMMYFFNVDANLMSLGAIDFGIIIDGAVIIVEFIAYQISRSSGELALLQGKDKQLRIDAITLEGTRKLTRSAIFGQLIIIIVFIPILSLSGIEGKMFRPMAQVFTFALLGTMILGFTYVPVVSSLFLKPAETKKNISTRLLDLLNRAYRPSITWALDHKKMVLLIAVVLLSGSLFIFSRMGGEFVPTLDEGDFVIQPVFKTGTTLSNTIELTTRIEQILKTFPEVDQVVSRIGAAEVPTDPMSMEESDIIITLKPRKEWVTAKTKDELADKFKEALLIIPGIDYEFTQPIEMRFNELITGTRADLAIKIFGEDLDYLNKTALRIKSLIDNVDGASDIIVEKTAGLPEMNIKYNREKLGIYGLSVDEVNRVVSMAFAGFKAGEIFEGEKRFDLVIRYDTAFRGEIEHIRNAWVSLPQGGQVPLSELAEISYSKGPAKISRDNTRRRVVVGVNVRNRDLESVVGDVKKIIETNIDLPPGYYIEYGGQFQNLRSARNRLMIAVPIALLLIFTLLHLAFGSLREAFMVYTAIPLSAVGGILLLWLRGMPFSISAGVGFIALFGIAVLNGIVLIEHFKELRHQGITNIRELIIRGTSERLRPVLLTAAAAAMGFLPMAVSSSAGAEVQRPLATVVVGGLITATLLTMIVLPVLYYVFETRSIRRNLRKKGAIISVILPILVLFSVSQAQAQYVKVSPDSLITRAMMADPAVKMAELETEAARKLKVQAFNPDNTVVYYNFDENNIAESGQPLKIWGIQQSLSFPGVYAARRAEAGSELKIREWEAGFRKNQLQHTVLRAYAEWMYALSLVDLYSKLDSLYGQMASSAERRFTSGETAALDQLTARARYREVNVSLANAKARLNEALQQLQIITGDTLVNKIPDRAAFEKYVVLNADTSFRNYRDLAGFQTDKARQSFKAERSAAFPDIHLEYFTGRDNGVNKQRYNGFQAGLGIPVWFPARSAAVKYKSIQIQMADEQNRLMLKNLKSKYTSIITEIAAAKQSLDYYQSEGSALGSGIADAAEKSFRAGEIGMMQYLNSLSQAAQIQQDHLHAEHQYRLLILEINHLSL